MSNTKKSLLNENTIRRFMKLAEIDTLSDGFVTGLVQEEVKEVSEEAQPFETAEEMAGPTGPEGGLEDELDVEPVEEPESAPEEHVELARAIENLMSVISELTGADISVGPDDLGDESEEMVDVSDVVGDENEAVMAEESASREAIHQENLRRAAAYKTAVKGEVLRRVNARLQEESRKDAMADQLSERILRRIKNQPKK